MEKIGLSLPNLQKKTSLFLNGVSLDLFPEVSHEVWATPEPWDWDSSDIAIVCFAYSNEWPTQEMEKHMQRLVSSEGPQLWLGENSHWSSFSGNLSWLHWRWGDPSGLSWEGQEGKALVLSCHWVLGSELCRESTMNLGKVTGNLWRLSSRDCLPTAPPAAKGLSVLFLKEDLGKLIAASTL